MKLNSNEIVLIMIALQTYIEGIKETSILAEIHHKDNLDNLKRIIKELQELKGGDYYHYPMTKASL